MLKSLLLSSAFLLSAISIPKSAAANSLSLADNEVDKIRAAYRQIDNIHPDDPFSAAHKMFLLRRISDIHELLTVGTYRIAPIAGDLRLTPSRVIPEFSVPISSQITAHSGIVEEQTAMCLSKPDTACLLDIAAAVAMSSLAFDNATSSLGEMLLTAKGVGEDGTRYNALSQLISQTIEHSQRYHEISEQGVPSYYFLLPLQLLQAGNLEGAEGLVYLFLREFPSQRQDLNPWNSAILGFNLMGRGTYSYEEVEARLKSILNNAESSYEHYAALDALIHFAHFADRSGNAINWIAIADIEITEATWSVWLGANAWRLGYQNELDNFVPDGWLTRDAESWESPAHTLSQNALISAMQGNVRQYQAYVDQTISSLLADAASEKTSEDGYRWSDEQFVTALIYLAEATNIAEIN